MAGPAARLSYAEYLSLEAAADAKHEFVDGVVHAMAGGSLEHARLASRLTFLLVRALGDRPCNVFSSDARVRIQATNRANLPGPERRLRPGDARARRPRRAHRGAGRGGSLDVCGRAGGARRLGARVGRETAFLALVVPAELARAERAVPLGHGQDLHASRRDPVDDAVPAV